VNRACVIYHGSHTKQVFNFESDRRFLLVMPKSRINVKRRLCERDSQHNVASSYFFALDSSRSTVLVYCAKHNLTTVVPYIASQIPERHPLSWEKMREPLSVAQVGAYNTDVHSNVLGT
jgi:hypothetical protein